MARSDESEEIAAIVLTGSEKAFAAGADIKEMKDKQFAEVYQKKFLGNWTKMNDVKKPIIGAVSGFAVSFSKITYACHELAKATINTDLLFSCISSVEDANWL